MFSFYSKRCYLGELDLLPFKDTFCIEFMSYSWHIHNSGNLASRIFLLMKSLSKSLFSSRLALIAKHYSVNIDLINSITSSEWRQYVKNSVRTKLIIKLRSGTCALESHLMRYDNIPREERTCPLCHLMCEDVPHFITECPALELERLTFIDTIRSIPLSLPVKLRALALSHLVNLHSTDLFRLALCAFESLSFSTSTNFSLWFSPIRLVVTEACFNFIFNLYSTRNSLKFS